MVVNPIMWLIDTVLQFYIYVVFAAVIVSWLVSFEVINMRNRFAYMIYDMLFRVTEPALKPIRRYVPNLGGLDISPVVLIILLYFAKLSVLWVYVNFFLSGSG